LCSGKSKQFPAERLFTAAPHMARCGPARDQSRPNAVTRLQVELVLALLLDDTQVGPQRRLGDCLGIVVVVLLPLQEWFDVDRGDDPRLVSQSTEHPADEVRAHASLHADGAWSQLLERIFETQSPDLPAEGDLPIDTKPDQVKNFLADVDADDRPGTLCWIPFSASSCFSCSPR
jgi:hypothetical protein